MQYCRIVDMFRTQPVYLGAKRKIQRFRQLYSDLKSSSNEKPLNEFPTEWKE
jgi:hypothetical protein